MRLLIFNHIANASESLRSNRTRTTLTMLGVMIGVASITLILSLSAGATKVITDQVSEMGGNIAVIRPGKSETNSHIENITSPMSTAYATSSLTETDVNTIGTLKDVSAVAPLMSISGSVRAEGNSPDNATVVATSPALQDVAELPVRDGQFIDDQTNIDTAVIGAQLSVDLFGTDQSIGKIFKIRGKNYTVIGILRPLNRPINYNNVDFDHAAIISLESGKQFNQNVAQIQQINVKASSTEALPQAVNQIKSQLDTNHGGEKDAVVLSGDELSRPTSQFFYAIAATMTAVAAISLVVGGIGIMNIMLVSVAERTREIGIRKALGASNGHIITQFLIESLAMSIGGGIIGFGVGYLLGFVVSRTALTFDPLFSWEIAGIAMGISVVVGTIFGLYPAIRASRKDPIEALRQYH
jgi:ABC-type antimicrobial peptide transport system permease subunit